MNRFFCCLECGRRATVESLPKEIESYKCPKCGAWMSESSISLVDDWNLAVCDEK